jgi:hypothetical protein
VVDFVAGGKSMALSFLSKLSKDEQQELMDDLNYLNISEIKSLCSHHSIPYRIAIETEDGGRRVTKDDDRKGVILHRIRHFLRTGVILQETRFQASVVCLDRLSDNITADNRLFYGHAGSRFRSGKIARKTVSRVNRAKCVIANLPAGRGIVRGGGPDKHFRLCFPRHDRELPRFRRSVPNTQPSGGKPGLAAFGRGIGIMSLILPLSSPESIVRPVGG